MRLLLGLLVCSSLLAASADAAEKLAQFNALPDLRPRELTLPATNQRAIQGLTESDLAGGVNHRRRKYDPWVCDAEWNVRCEPSDALIADDDYQACKLDARETTHDGNDSWFHQEPTQFYTNDPQSPDRFKAFNVTIHALGNNNPFDHRGSKEVVEMTLDQIPWDATSDQRFAAGCAMPPHD